MSIKKNAKSTLLTALLVSSLSCGLQASDMIEEGYRLQITGSYNLLSAEIAALQASVNAITPSSSALASQVAVAGANPVLTTAATAGTAFADYNTARVAVATALATAQATPNRTNILALQSAITLAAGLQETAAALGAGAAPYSSEGIVSAANVLAGLVNNWLSYYPAA